MKAPRFRCSNAELQVAFDKMADYMDRIANKKFSFGRNMVGSTTDDDVAMEATDPEEDGDDTHPWKPDITAADGGGTTMFLHPGTVSGILPSNMFDPFPMASPTANYFVKLACATNGKVVTAINIEVETTPPAGVGGAEESAAPESFEILVAVIRGGFVFQMETTNLTYLPAVALTVSRTPPSPGEEPYTRWYTWGKVV